MKYLPFFCEKDIDNNEYRENQPWPRVKNSMISNKSNHHLHHNHNNITINSVVAKKRNNSKKSREIVGGSGGGGLITRGSSISGSGATRISQNSSQISSQKSQHFRRSQNHRTSGASYMAQTVSTTTCTKTLGTIFIYYVITSKG